jgi:hypothetical protein
MQTPTAPATNIQDIESDDLSQARTKPTFDRTGQMVKTRRTPVQQSMRRMMGQPKNTRPAPELEPVSVTMQVPNRKTDRYDLLPARIFNSESEAREFARRVNGHITSIRPVMHEGYQDFKKPEPYAVCLAGRPVKQFDYYEQARRFHDNWKRKLYAQGEQAKADSITLNPVMKEEEQKPGFGEFPPKQEIKILPPKKLKSGETHQGINDYWKAQGQAPIYKTNEAGSPAQQAAIAIAKKKEQGVAEGAGGLGQTAGITAPTTNQAQAPVANQTQPANQPQAPNQTAKGLSQDQVRQTLNDWMNQDQQYTDPTERAGSGFQAKVWPYIQQNIKTILADKGEKGNGDYPAAPYAAWLLVQHMDAYPQNQIEFYNALKQAIPNHPKIQFLKDRAAVNQWIMKNANNPEYFIKGKALPNPTVNVRNPAMFKDAGIVATSREEALQNAQAAGNKLLVAAVQATNAQTQPSYKQGVAENFADGQNPGRKGLAKRSGVNTKASVSSLRKTARHSTGEKARMAHWLANMKAGRARKK